MFLLVASFYDEILGASAFCLSLKYSRSCRFHARQMIPFLKQNPFSFRCRICALFAVASLTLMIVSTLLATLGHCVRGHKMLLASGLYALGGKLHSPCQRCHEDLH